MEEFALCWNNFQDNIATGFQNLYLRGDLVDVTLAVDGQLLHAHKIVLAICSPYFQEIFVTNPCKHPIIILKDVTFSVMTELLQFMYQGEVNVKHSELPTFMKIAETLHIKGLTTTSAATAIADPHNNNNSSSNNNANNNNINSSNNNNLANQLSNHNTPNNHNNNSNLNSNSNNSRGVGGGPLSPGSVHRFVSAAAAAAAAAASSATAAEVNLSTVFGSKRSAVTSADYLRSPDDHHHSSQHHHLHQQQQHHHHHHPINTMPVYPKRRLLQPPHRLMPLDAMKQHHGGSSSNHDEDASVEVSHASDSDTTHPHTQNTTPSGINDADVLMPSISMVESRFDLVNVKRETVDGSSHSPTAIGGLSRGGGGPSSSSYNFDYSTATGGGAGAAYKYEFRNDLNMSGVGGVGDAFSKAGNHMDIPAVTPGEKWFHGKLEFMLSQRGKPLLVHDGFTFGIQYIRKDKKYWQCNLSRKFNCKARVTTTELGEIIVTNNEHCHTEIRQHLRKEYKLNRLNNSLNHLHSLQQQRQAQQQQQQQQAAINQLNLTASAVTMTNNCANSSSGDANNNCNAENDSEGEREEDVQSVNMVKSNHDTVDDWKGALVTLQKKD